MDQLMKKLAMLLLAGFLFFLCLAGAWGYGVLSFKNGLFPYEQVKSAVAAARNSFDVMFVPHHLYPAVYDFSGARVHDRGRISNGSTLITSYFSDLDWRPGIKLLDVDGNVLHTWNADPSILFPEKSNLINNYVHGTYLFPNGDILVNLEFMGLVRMGPCGDIKWKLGAPAAHHSITPSPDGNFWVSTNVIWPDDQEGRSHLAEYPLLQPPLYEDHATKVSPDGKVLQDINLIDVVYRNHLERAIRKIGRQYSGDIFHLNDVEELTAEMAESYPLFEAGDLVVSLRYLDLVMVFDPDTLAVKWYSLDLTIQQHDPDFIGDGWIGIFDNNDDGARGAYLGGSRIVAIQPHTGARKVLYPNSGADPFYTSAGGKWQLLPNGNMLMVEARKGRALEVAPDGTTVWEWVNERYDEKRVSEVLEATRYDIGPDEIASWGCARVALGTK
jgi:hypothetical protein